MPVKPPSQDNRVLPAKRQRLIAQFVLERGVIRVEQLAHEFGVSVMTVRRDLVALEETGKLERTFGGAVATEQAAHELNFAVRLESNRLQKEAIASYTATLVNDGDTLATDASTTGLMLARRLYSRAVTVITNSLDIAQELRVSKARVICTGGWYRAAAGSLVGPLALQTLSSLRVDHAFFSAKGVLIPGGFVDSHLDEIEVKRAMLRGAARVTALIDADKFDKRALGCIAPLHAPQLLITDDTVSEEARRKLEAQQVKVHIVQVDHAAA